MESNISLPACPVKLETEMGDYDQSNGYGEPLAKRANNAPTPNPSSAPAPVITATSRNQCKLYRFFYFA